MNGAAGFELHTVVHLIRPWGRPLQNLESMREALAGSRAGGTGTIWPWQTAPLILAVPVTSGGEVIGAVVTLSPTSRLHAAIVQAWTVAGILGLAAGRQRCR